MHAVFAVEPQALNCWHNFRYLIEKFGYSNGVLIARYPKSWMRLVIEACDANDVGDVEKLKIVEKLQQVKNDRMLNIGYSFDGGDWLDNVLKLAVPGDFDALVLLNDNGRPNSYAVDDVPEELFLNRREKQVLRDSASLASAAGCLFVKTTELILIDPYLKPSKACTNLLNAFVEESFLTGKGITKIIIHSAYSKDPSSSEEVIQNYKKHMSDKFNSGLTMQVNRWNDNVMEFDFHARYLITENAGLRYDRGFNEPSDHGERSKKTDIACLQPSTVKTLLEQYQSSEFKSNIFDVINIS
jgi:hypothetical protein